VLGGCLCSPPFGGGGSSNNGDLFTVLCSMAADEVGDGQVAMLRVGIIGRIPNNF
jgi:hypothetical protein